MAGMQDRIMLLDPLVSARIAAGEVVEQPASVVRELVDNAIDAGATSISIELTDGGLTAIRVVDNGSGMGAADLARSVLKHATSKIRSLEDLDRVTSMGFRGEALFAIASVSRLRL
ncbi:MAG TPA: DNA mismatch repair endonuclease MutL, partial [Spirochaetota bacterium]|nr:DNA mismatch repair endonuclease MutL [Spirochaetota bacterium]